MLSNPRLFGCSATNSMSPWYRKTWKHRAESITFMSDVQSYIHHEISCTQSSGFIRRDYGTVRRRAEIEKCDSKIEKNRLFIIVVQEPNLICALNATIREAVLHLTGWRHQGFYGRSIQRTRSSIAIPDVLARVQKVSTRRMMFFFLCCYFLT